VRTKEVNRQVTLRINFKSLILNSWVDERSVGRPLSRLRVLRQQGAGGSDAPASAQVLADLRKLSGAKRKKRMELLKAKQF
jgi:hypothetical protein